MSSQRRIYFYSKFSEDAIPKKRLLRSATAVSQKTSAAATPASNFGKAITSNLQVTVDNDEALSIHGFQRITSLEAELRHQQEQYTSMENTKDGEIRQLRTQLNQLRQKLNVHHLQCADRAWRDKQISSNLVSQLQRDISDREATICTLDQDIEKYQRQLSEKDITIAALQYKV